MKMQPAWVAIISIGISGVLGAGWAMARIESLESDKTRLEVRLDRIDSRLYEMNIYLARLDRRLRTNDDSH